ncbi:MAG: GNAT family protein [Rubrivivax sp.]|nr:GNAT family protein [Rubrivivax sp.]
MNTITLQEITAASVRDIVALTVTPEQARFVAPNAVSLAQALFHPEAWYRAVVADATPVGFVMLEDPSQLAELPPKPYLALWRFMIDARFQRQGYGRCALELIVDHACRKPGIAELLTSCVPGPGSPEAFYRRYGFAPTGEIDDGETVLRLPL